MVCFYIYGFSKKDCLNMSRPIFLSASFLITFLSISLFYGCAGWTPFQNYQSRVEIGGLQGSLGKASTLDEQCSVLMDWVGVIKKEYPNNIIPDIKTEHLKRV